MDRYTQITVLCEDLQQYSFIHHFLIKCGIPRQRIRKVPYPISEGSAEQHVRQQYPLEIQAYRRKRNQLQIGLVVMIDADQQTVEHHYRELETALTQAKQEQRQPDERIGIYIPKRNIETWIYYLQGHAVNEETDYKPLVSKSDCKPVAESLAEKRGQPLAEDAPPSLHTACGELGRILP